MKKYASLLSAIACVFSFSGIAQGTDAIVVSYHVVEKINRGFGDIQITTYDVSTLSLVSTTDLGPNNSRTITPKYAKRATKATTLTPAQVSQTTSTPLNALMSPMLPTKMAIAAQMPEKVYVSIDILGTYERVIDKGYKSVDMLTKIANGRYFDGDLVLAAKWYGQLFEMTTDLDAVYFYRYAQSLKAINELEKSREMMKLFESRNMQNANQNLAAQIKP